MDIVLWIAQVVLALGMLAFGFAHATQRHPDNDVRTAWMDAVPKVMLTTIGILELLAAVGLVLPGLTKVAPWLTPLAAWLVALLMVSAMVFHARRGGEGPNIAFNGVLLAVALVVAIGRTFVAPL